MRRWGSISLNMDSIARYLYLVAKLVKLVGKTKLISIKLLHDLFFLGVTWSTEKFGLFLAIFQWVCCVRKPGHGLGAQGGASISRRVWSLCSSGWISTSRNTSLQGSVVSYGGTTFFPTKIGKSTKTLLFTFFGIWTFGKTFRPGAFECHRVAATAESCRKCCAWGDETAGCMKGLRESLQALLR